MFAKTLPQTQAGWFLSDGGIETSLIYLDGMELPEFAAFVLLDDAPRREVLRRYFVRYLEIAEKASGAGFVLESPTWRAGLDWCRKLGYDERAMQRVNRDGIDMMLTLRREYAQRIAGPIVVSGCIGPRGDGYLPGAPMSGDDAMHVHLPQARALALPGVDLLTAITMTTTGEAIGVARAAEEVGRPCVISFTVETDGRLPSGETLAAAIETTDREVSVPPAYYMINCAHPSHFESVLDAGAWTGRIRGFRGNASTLSHTELDAMTTLDAGDPEDLASRYRQLRSSLPNLNVLGGCCGTDQRHIAAIAAAWSRP